jgi:hypothetical protein
VNRAGLITELARLWEMPRIRAEWIVETVFESIAAGLTRGAWARNQEHAGEALKTVPE